MDEQPQRLNDRVVAAAWWPTLAGLLLAMGQVLASETPVPRGIDETLLPAAQHAATVGKPVDTGSHRQNATDAALRLGTAVPLWSTAARRPLA